MTNAEALEKARLAMEFEPCDADKCVRCDGFRKTQRRIAAELKRAYADGVEYSRQWLLPSTFVHAARAEADRLERGEDLKPARS